MRTKHKVISILATLINVRSATTGVAELRVTIHADYACVFVSVITFTNPFPVHKFLRFRPVLNRLLQGKFQSHCVVQNNEAHGVFYKTQTQETIEQVYLYYYWCG